MDRHATAVWNGSGKEGGGNLSTQSGVLSQTQYSFNSRFAEGIGTNPEELIAAAHAGCFSMKLSFVIGAAGFTPTSINTKCVISLNDGAITQSELTCEASVPGMGVDEFKAAVEDAANNCPISKLLNTSIVTNATLV
jgi:lipoyl-dependent peroxiredoxin